MKVYTVSDLHLDYPANREWLHELDRSAYVNDVLILAGDISDSLTLIDECFCQLMQRFAAVFYVPGNHDLWVNRRQSQINTSIEKFDAICSLAAFYGVQMQPCQYDGVSIIPLLSWYDGSFGNISPALREIWMDYYACIWPERFDEKHITEYFLALNPSLEDVRHQNATITISFSHFVPRLDVMPDYIPIKHRQVYPVLGSVLLDKQLRELGADIHIYGHSHVNRAVSINGVKYLNNSLGYPNESQFTRRQLLCVYP
ncbi:metallophosphoesterase [Xenorhabdus sp. PB62.4]|uniref:metallophosphoesterase n=1 Tax=Xenorhabdus sp. PB62.4 TaxID=1851573 RepID=UPI001CA40D0A|nr:metallophosphoesterase [Xenorhabdus sp. PB62.4]MBC8951927.1 phosphoesterase [Xenorhabdus sp. PB62.4]